MNLLLILLASLAVGLDQEPDFWVIHDVPEPDGIALEVGGILALGNESVLACTRRGKIWRIENAYSDSPSFTLYADGLREPLGLSIHTDDLAAWEQSIEDGIEWTGDVWCAQRGELTRMRDTDGDGRGDLFETFCDEWQTRRLPRIRLWSRLHFRWQRVGNAQPSLWWSTVWQEGLARLGHAHRSRRHDAS